ncbi:PEP-CTERM sorting domain-containing protein [Paucibacter sp. R3-3]|uniref:PEP-CTERM sorting domain-containing protein n=1 Tax=Roseateles agri TaxID=3098619 RepID=A0ABU5DDD1_9BURK|nr:PEP-CTERM sorting domain-containing protein [Paucibacter sp. R3-3]MDY0743760.1 PEP-CTERM sorting domain-containing protein [Paucibacter sp. R3-3]
MKTPFLALALAASALLSSQANATVYAGVNFPAGSISFADEFVSRSYPTAAQAPDQYNNHPEASLGVPNYVSGGGCTAKTQPCTFMSLGNGGSAIWRFTDNVLVPDGTSNYDLAVFEVGPSVEPMYVAVSKDGVNWSNVGALGGSTSAVDLDSYGFTAADHFSYVRLTDANPNHLTTGGGSSGADIDAIGAISTLPVAAVPEPATVALMLAGLVGIGFSARRKAR